MNCVRVVPQATIEFYLFDKFKYLLNDSFSNKNMRNLFAGSISGTISYICIYPIDYSRVMLSVNAIPKGYRLH